MYSPTGLIPWFSKTEGNTYATLLHHPLLFKGKPTQCSRGSTLRLKKITNKEPRKMMQGCNGLSSLPTIRSSYSSGAPLDSMAIDPITRSPNYHHETGKIENLSRANLCLAHSSLELDDDDLDFLKLDHLS